MIFKLKMEKTLPVLVVSTGLMFTHSTFAQEADVDNRGNIYGGVSWLDPDDDRNLDSDYGYVVGGEMPVSPRWSLALENWGVEVDSEVIQDQTDFFYTRLGGNYHLNKWGAFQPYLSMGIGHTDLNPDIMPNENETAVDLGIGAKTFLSEHWMLRGDIKALYSDGDQLDYLAGLSLGYVFGTRSAPAPAPAPDPDSDGDGVPDSRDNCPNTPTTLAVDSSGCPILETSQEQQTLEASFGFDSTEIEREARDDIARFAEFMTTYANTDVVIEGHTDSSGPEDYNQGLSERRAEAVRQELINDGIAPSRIRAVGYGESRPIASNDTPEGREQNRRITATVTAIVETEVPADGSAQP